MMETPGIPEHVEFWQRSASPSEIRRRVRRLRARSGRGCISLRRRRPARAGLYFGPDERGARPFASRDRGNGARRTTDRSEERGLMSELSAEQTRLAQLWEEHMRHEFQTCSTEDTLAT